jgi:hypothetical protein
MFDKSRLISESEHTAYAARITREQRERVESPIQTLMRADMEHATVDQRWSYPPIHLRMGALCRTV